MTSTIDSDAGQVLRVDSANTSHGEWTEAELTEPTTTAQFTAQIAELRPQEEANLRLVVDVRGTQQSPTHLSLRHTVDVHSANAANNSATVRIPEDPGPTPGDGDILNPG